MVTFVCHLCGTQGAAPSPGVTRCEGCGHLAFVDGPQQAEAQRAPDASRSQAAARPANGANGAPAQRLATLWVRPNPEQTGAEPIPERSRARRPVLLAAFVGGTALALAAAIATAPQWIGTGAGTEAARADASPPAPVARPDPPPAPTAAPAPPAAPRERLASMAAGKGGRIAPARRVASAPSDGPSAPRPAALVNPAPVDRRCIPRALRARRDVHLPEEIAVRFAVSSSGAVGPIEVLGGLKERDVARAVEDAIRSCPFTPGQDEEGRPTSLPVLMRIRFSPAPDQSGF